MTMTKDEIYYAITNWQMEAGEDFCDYFESNFNAANFMFWCHAKGYISTDKFNRWEEAMADKNDWNADDMRSVVQSDEPYALVSEDDWTETGEELAYGTLAEFFEKSITYQRRLQEFLEENPI